MERTDSYIKINSDPEQTIAHKIAHRVCRQLYLSTRHSESFFFK